MNNLRLLVIGALLTVLVACGGGEQPAGEAAPEAPAATVPPPAPAEAPAEAAAEPAEPAQPEVVTESAADESAPAKETGTLREAITKSDSAAPARTDWKYPAGKYYTQLTTAQGTADLTGGIEVAEVFWYGCPHCFNFDPYVTRWESSLPEDVRFVRIPVMWNPTNEIHARMYYTAETLDKLPEMHSAFFRALHLEKKTLTREEDIRDFFAGFGVSAEDFDKTFRSFGVESKLKRAKNLTTRYRIASVPILVVDGKYLTDGPDIKSFDDMIAVADELIEREREAR